MCFIGHEGTTDDIGASRTCGHRGDSGIAGIDNRFIQWVTTVDGTHLRRNRITHFINIITFSANGAFLHSQMTVSFNHSREHLFSGCVDDQFSGFLFQIFTDCGNFSILHANIRLYGSGSGHCMNPSILN